MLWDRDCFGMGCRAKRQRSQCLSCAVSAGRDWNPKIEAAAQIIKAIRTLYGNCPRGALKGTILRHVGAASDYKELVGRQPLKDLSH